MSKRRSNLRLPYGKPEGGVWIETKIAGGGLCKNLLRKADMIGRSKKI